MAVAVESPERRSLGTAHEIDSKGYWCEIQIVGYDNKAVVVRGPQVQTRRYRGQPQDASHGQGCS